MKDRMKQTELRLYLCQGRESACEQIMIGFDFISALLVKWRDVFEPKSGIINAKPKKERINILHSTSLRSNQVKSASESKLLKRG